MKHKKYHTLVCMHTKACGIFYVDMGMREHSHMANGAVSSKIRYSVEENYIFRYICKIKYKNKSKLANVDNKK